MEPYIEVIDNFFKSPDDIRSMALEEKYEKFNTGYYGGCDTTNTMIVIDEMKEKINNIFGKEMKIKQSRFRYIREKDYARYLIHTDKLNSKSEKGFHVIISLTPDELIKENDSTVFYEHNKIGRYLKSQEEVDILNKESLMIEKFNEYKSVEHKYNRCIILDYDFFHSPRYINGYGSSIEDSRLLYITEVIL